MYIKNLLVQENINLDKIDESFDVIKGFIANDLSAYANENCNIKHDHLNLNMNKNSDKKCLDDMIRNYIYDLLLVKSQEYLNNKIYGNNNIIIEKENKKVETFVNKYTKKKNNINNSFEDNEIINTKSYNFINEKTLDKNRNNSRLLKESICNEFSLPLLNRKINRNNDLINDINVYKKESKNDLDKAKLIIKKQESIIKELLKNYSA